MYVFLGLIIFLAGAGIGLLLLEITIFMMQRRVETIPEHWLVRGRRASYIWMLTTGAGCLGLYLLLGISLRELEGIFVFLAVLVLSAVDIVIRKIPNSIVLTLLLGAVGFTLLQGTPQDLIGHLMGMATGMMIFLIPFLFGRQAGMGDIKFAAAIGFTLGFFYTVVAFVIMSIFFLFYVSFLLISQKGNLKTKTALAPYMSVGFVVSLVLCRVG